MQPSPSSSSEFVRLGVSGGFVELLRATLPIVNRAIDGIREVMRVDFDAVVCDVMMPGMRGDMFYTAVDRLKPQLCRGFVFITAYRDDSDTSLFLQTVGCDFVYKPLDTTDLLAKVTRAILRVRQDSSAAAA